MEETIYTHTLLAITGLSPQVVTETLYAIHQQGQPWPDELIILTTRKGKEQAELGLCHPRGKQQNSMLDQCCIDLKRPPFGENKIHIKVVPDHHGHPVDDARSREDQEALADFIVKEVAQLCADPKRIVHASLAGGRKTMTFFLGYAMSLFARQNDQLSHVLITPVEYEGLRGFYYPTPYTNPIEGRGENQHLDTHEDKVQVILADIPFIRQRDNIGVKVLNNFSNPQTQVSYRQLVQLQNIAHTLSVSLEQNKQAIEQHRKSWDKNEKAAASRKKTSVTTHETMISIEDYIERLANPLQDLKLEFKLAEKVLAIFYRNKPLIQLDMQGQELILAFYAMVARHDYPASPDHFCRALIKCADIRNHKLSKPAIEHLLRITDLYLYELEQIIFPEQSTENENGIRERWENRLQQDEELQENNISHNPISCYRTVKALLDEAKLSVFDQRQNELRDFLQNMLPNELVKLIEPDFTYYNSGEGDDKKQISFKQDPTMKWTESKKESGFFKSLGLKVRSNLLTKTAVTD